MTFQPAPKNTGALTDMGISIHRIAEDVAAYGQDGKFLCDVVETLFEFVSGDDAQAIFDQLKKDISNIDTSLELRNYFEQIQEKIR